MRHKPKAANKFALLGNKLAKVASEGKNRKSFGLILANINKNVLKAQIPSYAKALETNGVLMLSGFFDSDVNELTVFAGDFNLKKEHVYLKDNWAAIQLRKEG